MSARTLQQSTRIADDDSRSSVPATTTTTSITSPHSHAALLRFLLRALRRGGLLCVLLAVAKLVLGEPICAYMMQFYAVKLQTKGRQPVALQLWRTLGGHP